jgi:hypothetical protein
MPTLRTAALAGALLALPSAADAAEAQPNFSVVVTFSQEALAKLTGLKEQVTVAAMYSGAPTKEAEKKKISDEIGEVGLGNEELTRPLAGRQETFVFTGKTFQTKRTKWIQPGTAALLINVYSARKVSDDNLLDCGLFQDTVVVANSKPIEIACKLIGE